MAGETLHQRQPIALMQGFAEYLAVDGLRLAIFCFRSVGKMIQEE
jgi:hypothetical protein